MATKKKASADAPEETLRPEEVETLDALEALETIETALRDALRGVRAKLLPKIDPEKPTMLESAAGERPVTAAALAAASGLALGFVVRRIIPWRLK